MKINLHCHSNYSDGYVSLDKEYYDILNEKTVSGRIDIKPYEALILKEI